MPEPRAPVPKKRDRETPARRGALVSGLSRVSFQEVSIVFKEPIYKMLHKIKKEPFFKWPPKMQGDSSSRDPKSKCS